MGERGHWACLKRYTLSPALALVSHCFLAVMKFVASVTYTYYSDILSYLRQKTMDPADLALNL